MDADGDVRCFHLREHSVLKGVEFLRKFDLLRQDAARVESLDLMDVSPEAWATVADGADELLLWLLDRPEGNPADLTWLKALTLTQRTTIVNAQSRLNQLEEVSGNFLAILRLLWAARMAVEMVSAGGMNGSGGKLATASPQPTDSIRIISLPPGPSASVSSDTASLPETAGKM